MKKGLLKFLLLGALFCLGLTNSFAASVWKGTTSSAWNVAGNWTGGVPTGVSDVTIPAGTPNAPTVNVSSSCKSLTTTGTVIITLNANLTITGGDLTVGGGYTLTLGGTSAFTLSLVGGSVVLNYNGNLNISGSNTTLSLTGGNIDLTAGNNLCYIINSGKINLTGGTVKFGYQTFLTNNSSGSVTTTGTIFDIPNSGNNSVLISNAGTFSATGGSFNLISQGTSINNTGTFSISGTTITLGVSSGSGNLTNITNSGTFTADNNSIINIAGYQTYISNSSTGIFHAGTSGSACTINATWQGNSGSFYSITNAGTFYLGSTSIVNLTGTDPSNPNKLVNTGTFTFQSDANGSASLGALGAGGSATGTYKAERYVQGNSNSSYRGYRLMSSPVNTSSLIDLSYLPNSAIVTGATCTGCTVAGNPTIYLYNETLPVNNTSFVSGNFVGVTNISGTTISTLSGSTTTPSLSLPYGNGFFLFFRGDKTTNITNKTTAPFALPESVTFTASGTLTQGNVVVKDWFNQASSTLSYTNSSALAKGFNLVGNPYACSIDWDKLGSGITATNLDNTIYIYNTVQKNYSTYTSGNSGIPGTNWPSTTTHNANIIPSGQGFFVRATSASPALTFTETGKSSTNQQQASTTNLLLSSAPATLTDPQYFRVQLKKDSINNEDVLIWFNSSAKPEYVINEDAVYLKGGSPVSLSTMSSDNIALAINSLALPKQNQTIPLNVTISNNGTYNLTLTEVKNLPDLYDIWLMDNYKKDSLDMKHNPNYSFSAIVNDTTTYGSKRFKLVVRQNPSYAYHLLSFGGTKVNSGDQINWTTQNEANYTSFELERSIDGGKIFSTLGTVLATGTGTYGYMDSTPAKENQYRLKQTDLNGAISYSNILKIQYSDLANSSLGNGNISVYPNPVRDVINLTIVATTNSTASYTINIMNSSGNKIKTFTSQQTVWQNSISDLLPGAYIVQVINNIDKSIVGRSKFTKLE